jgi:hypothetical protein
MARVFFLAIIFYLLYRLVFDLIVPVYKTTKQVKKQFSDIHDRMQQGPGAQPQQPSSPPSPATGSKIKAGEYIDFEEIK